jgi:hypothetical protein
MLEKIPELLQGWSERWGRLFFSPQTHFKGMGSRSIPEAALFLLGNELLSYLALNLTAIGYFALFYHTVLVRHIADSAKDRIEASIIIFPIYVILLLGVLLIAATVSFAAYRSLNKSSHFSAHLAVFLDLSVADLPAAVACVLVLVDNPSWSSPMTLVGLGLFVIVRLWRLYLGYQAMEALYSPVGRSRWPRFIWGFALTDFFLGSVVVGVSFLLLVFVVTTWD